MKKIKIFGMRIKLSLLISSILGFIFGVFIVVTIMQKELALLEPSVIIKTTTGQLLLLFFALSFVYAFFIKVNPSKKLRNLKLSVIWIAFFNGTIYSLLTLILIVLTIFITLSLAA